MDLHPNSVWKFVETYAEAKNSSPPLIISTHFASFKSGFPTAYEMKIHILLIIPYNECFPRWHLNQKFLFLELYNHFAGENECIVTNFKMPVKKSSISCFLNNSYFFSFLKILNFWGGFFSLTKFFLLFSWNGTFKNGYR